MLQQLIAVIIILAFLLRLFREKRREEISRSEFALWLSFWSLSLLAVVGIKQIDRLVAWLGFSGSGINFLIYLAVLVLFYFIFRLRLSLGRLDRSLTELTRSEALKEKRHG